jgi:hypothetical protein
MMMRVVVLIGLAFLVGAPVRGARLAAADPARPVTFVEYLQESAVSTELIDRFLQGPSWAQFDPELGYILGNYLPADGIDHSATISTVQPNGARTSRVYVDRKCRINTYGDSFTQCHQVSDAETWQEYLAGHLGEPIRNFGMGGYGVYQAYRRMIREEATDHGAEYLIFYIWGDDHVRSLLRCRHANIFRQWDHQGGRMFHNNFWPNLDLNLQTGAWIEHDNLLPTQESLYHMTDPQWMVEHLQDDLALQLSIGHYNPRGNHLFAFSIKDQVVEWLDPKPITYRPPDPQSIDFRGYLPGSGL